MRIACLLPLACLALLAQAPQPREGTLRAQLALLADPLLEGRGTGQRGGELAVRYLETQLQVLGFRPANGASYRQAVPLAGVRLDAAASGLSFHGTGGSLVPVLGEDVVVGAAAPEAALAVAAPLVFVGHGIAAPDGSRDDYKGLDVRGKVLLMLVGDRQDGLPMPPCCGAENQAGRWTHKFEEARRHGAAGVLLIHTPPSAGYGWPVVRNGWMQERFLREGASERGIFQGWMTEAFADRLFRLAGLDGPQLRARAQRLDFHPVPLPIQVQGRLVSQLRSLTQNNVAGVLPGTDPTRSRDLVIYSAHWDHFGVDQAGAIYPGAVDNGTGCAAVLALAQALAQRPLACSVMCLFPCAEEQGLQGSAAYVAAPLWPLARTRLVVNLESLNVIGPTRDIGLLGTRDPRLRALCAQAAADVGLVITPERPDPAGLCFRSDHWPFMQAGVWALSPGFSLDGGWDYLGDKASAQARASDFLNHYHRPSDRYHAEWNLEGLLQQARFALELGRRVATAP